MKNLDDHLAGVTDAHARLLAALEGLTDRQARQPSLLPDWSVGHVLTHVARNAEALGRMVVAAARGEVGAMYPDGLDARNADIEAGSGRSAADLVDDVRTTAGTLDEQLAAMPGDSWSGSGQTLSRAVSMADVPLMRWREVDVHHADLGGSYTWKDWPMKYVRAELPVLTMVWASRQSMGMTQLPAAALRCSEHERVAWLMGRATIDGLDPAQTFG
jgi:maleylpyruvate isomerase